MEGRDDGTVGDGPRRDCHVRWCAEANREGLPLSLNRSRTWDSTKKISVVCGMTFGLELGIRITMTLQFVVTRGEHTP